ncbi:VTC domain protein [Clostridiales bacterium CHKCI001]|nr:VTC domain protein [Clostridiales bacterium CHKCI001]
MGFRHEYKYYINYGDYIVLRQRLKAVLQSDPYADENGEYHIRSLYFDNYSDKVLREKLDGVSIREKFRIRYYNHDLNVISLEKKSKVNGLCKKQAVRITKEQAQEIINGEIEWMEKSKNNLLVELYAKMHYEQLRPKVIVDYIREPFIFPAGNVRITLDRDIRTGLWDIDALSPDVITIPAGDVKILLEVKYDAFLPSIVRDIIQLNGRKVSAFSKYASCRMYG